MPKYGTDYSKSAIELKNPLEVRDLLISYNRLRKVKDAAEKAFDDAKVLLPEAAPYNQAVKDLEAIVAKLKEGIDRAGSYQDIAEGYYALKQKRESVSYNPKWVKQYLPQFAEAVITETVDGAKINGLKKGGLIGDAELSRIEVRTLLSPAYIIDIARQEGTKE